MALELLFSRFTQQKPIFDTETEIPDLSEKVIVVTGGTAGLGRESVLSFAAHGPAHIYFTGRSRASADQLIQDATSKFPRVPVTFVQCDLASLESVVGAAKLLLAQTQRLDILLCNAGIMAVPPGLTGDGYEIQFGTNHMGHALLVKLLTPLMRQTSDQQGEARIVWNTSLGYKGHPSGGIHFDTLKTTQAQISPVMGAWIRYGQSKLANLLYARAFAQHNPSIISVSIHPGVSATGLVTSLSFSQRALVYVTNVGNMLTPEACAWNQQWAATAPLGRGSRQVESGTYYEPVGLKAKTSGSAGDDELAESLWIWTQNELAPFTL